MKCIKSRSTGIIERVATHEARARVKNGLWLYVPKHVWKNTRRR